MGFPLLCALCFHYRIEVRAQAPRSRIEPTADMISAVKSTWLLHPWVSEVGDVVEILTEKGAGKRENVLK